MGPSWQLSGRSWHAHGVHGDHSNAAVAADHSRYEKLLSQVGHVRALDSAGSTVCVLFSKQTEIKVIVPDHQVTATICVAYTETLPGASLGGQWPIPKHPQTKHTDIASTGKG